MDKLIIKYTEGKFSKEELEKIKKLFLSKKVDWNNDAQLTTLWENLDNSEIGDKDRFKAILKEIHQNIERREKYLKRRRSYISVMKYAALFLIPIFSILFYLSQNDKLNLFGGDLVEINVPYGKVNEITLPDGTKVWLNSGSELSYHRGLKGKERNVKLDGEGYFEVVKNPSRPFIVKGNQLTVKVLGTKFNFKAYKEGQPESVTLMEGKVSLKNNLQEDSRQYILKPNQQAIVQEGSDELRINQIDVATTNAWRDGILVFDNEELWKIAQTLERAYNVKFEFRNTSIKQLRFYGKFIKDRPLNEILDVIVSNQSFSYKIETGKVIF
ncbi:MAG: DUF4974 domain-containing protein [Dysgonamonadaceae bacterium]